ncbi:MAG: phage holin family protein [Gemmatimonadota bacterium]|nr:MAG: phage holin family protein [Gemmatimonadota bacterium]
MTVLGRWVLCACAVAIAAWIAPGFEGGDVRMLGLAALGVAGVVVLVHAVLPALPFPVPLVALALLYLFLNALLLEVAARLLPGFGFAHRGGLVVAALLATAGLVAVLAVSGRRRRTKEA